MAAPLTDLLPAGEASSDAQLGPLSLDYVDRRRGTRPVRQAVAIRVTRNAPDRHNNPRPVTGGAFPISRSSAV